MGSVMMPMECPHCGSENCTDDYYYKTGEEYAFCPDCGYERIFRYKRDENGQLIKKDEAKDFEFDNLVTEEVHIENPYCSFNVTYRDSFVSTIGSIPTKEIYDQLIESIKEDNTVETVSISMFVDGKIVKEVVIDNGPTFDSAGFSETDN
jgi:DNA-directed RNA polymerase subunit RPC12/RpoP